jgi:hypothetical protein
LAVLTPTQPLPAAALVSKPSHGGVPVERADRARHQTSRRNVRVTPRAERRSGTIDALGSWNCCRGVDLEEARPTSNCSTSPCRSRRCENEQPPIRNSRTVRAAPRATRRAWWLL